MECFFKALSKCRHLGEKLIDKKLTVSFAESCTAGLASAMLADVPGISDVLIEGAVTYSNNAKIRLGVDAEKIKSHGAVSFQVAEEMAVSIRERSGSDFGISVTGIAGPGGGSAEKPVGLVYIALASQKGIKHKKLNLTGSRFEIRCASVYNMMKLIEEEMMNND